MARLPLVCGNLVRLHELPFRLTLIPLGSAYLGPEAAILLVLLVLEDLRRPFAPARWPARLLLQPPVRPWLTPRLILFSGTPLPAQKTAGDIPQDIPQHTDEAIGSSRLGALRLLGPRLFSPRRFGERRRLRVHLFSDQLQPLDYARLRRLLLRMGRGEAFDTPAARAALRFNQL